MVREVRPVDGDHRLAQGRPPFVAAVEHARTDRVPFGLVGIEQALWRAAVNLGQLPSQVHGVLDTGVDPLSAGRRMLARRVSGQEYAALAVGRCLPSRIGDPRCEPALTAV
jgi:hypothetical protein